MRANSASVGVLALAMWLAGPAALLAAPALALAQADPTADGRIAFDIGAQRLGDAIAAYSRATGFDVLLDGTHAQRPARAVRGRFTPAQALQAMLAGTGLEARHASATSVVIEALRTPDTAGQATAADAPGIEESGFHGGDVLHQSYAAQVQHALRAALCGAPETRPGSYRLALQLRLDARGAVERPRLLSTTGETPRDAAVLRTVRTLAVGTPPPATLPQPLVILLLPEGPGAEPACAPAAALGAPQ
jgi:hypothetical protein